MERTEQKETRREGWEEGKVLEFKGLSGRSLPVILKVNSYQDNRSLCVTMDVTADGMREPYGNLTVNLEGKPPHYCAYVDVNNMPYAREFLETYGLAEDTGLTKRSGYCDYPLYLFRPERLGELDPDGLAFYKVANRIADTEQEKKREGR